MVSQEQIFEFFQKMSIDLDREGYKILDNLIHEFPNIKYESEIIEKNIKLKQEEELDDNEEELD